MPAKQTSKRDYISRRKARVRDLYVTERLAPREIAARLVQEETIETTDESLESAIRIVRGDVAALRSELVSHRSGDADPSLAFDDLDALEAELTGLRVERDRQLVIAAGEPVEMCARSRREIGECAEPQCIALGNHVPFIGPRIGITMTDTPQGMMTSWKALWPAGVRQKASKDVAILTRQISELEVKLAEKRRTAVPKKKDGDDAGTGDDDFFRIVASDRSMVELIAENTTPAEKTN